LITLSEENTRLFGEQVNDHIEKLNDLMGHASGDDLNAPAFRKTCFANKLLEGSTRMLGLDDWSRTLGLFGNLLEKASGTTGMWDENLSQIVSEILETEEQVVAEIMTGEIEEVDKMESFDGLQREMELLMDEAYPEGKADSSPSFEEIGRVSIVNEEGPSPANEDDIFLPRGETRRAGNDARKFSTIERLVNSLGNVKDKYMRYLDDPEDNESGIRDLELAFGQSEFFIGLLGNILGQIGVNGRKFRSKVPSRTVLDGIEDFVEMNGLLHGWKVGLSTSAENFSMERETASDLAVAIESCIYDICRKFDDKAGSELSLNLEIVNAGSFLVATLKDNARSFLCDSHVDRDDEVAFYKGLLRVRGILKKWRCLLWVEPCGGRDGRFRFTFPRTSMITDYRILKSSGSRVALPCHCMEAILNTAEHALERDDNGMHVDFNGDSIPVCALGDLASEELEGGGGEDRIAILGLAEKRLGILFEGNGRRIEGIREQLTEGEWAGMAESVLHIGDEEYPVLDPKLVLERYGMVLGFDGSSEEPALHGGASSGGAAEERISRV